jgi:hypothetical protein
MDIWRALTIGAIVLAVIAFNVWIYRREVRRRELQGGD